jgi:DNA-binding HxlR family transcriptional regulator
VSSELISSKWSVGVLYLLAGGTRRYSEIFYEVGEVSKKALTQTLRSLEHDGLVARRAYAEMPMRVEYSLTQLGWSITTVLMAMYEWAAEHDTLSRGACEPCAAPRVALARRGAIVLALAHRRALRPEPATHRRRAASTAPPRRRDCRRRPRARRARAAASDRRLFFHPLPSRSTSRPTASPSEDLAISIEEVCDVPPAYAKDQAAQLAGADGVAVISPRTRVYMGKRRLTGGARRVPARRRRHDAPHRPARAAEPLAGQARTTPLPTFVTRRAQITD